MSSSGFVNYVLDVLSPIGNIKAQKMFGGYGISMNGIFFGIISDDILYFKVDTSNQANYESYGSKPFLYEKSDGKKIVMSYWEVPVDLLENSDKLSELVKASVNIAIRAKKLKKAQ
jgi:DNA transformation protein